MPPFIERIETAGPDRRARRLFFEGEEPTRTTSAAVVKALGLAEGVDADLSEVAATETNAARDRALGYLGYRERSSHELVKRLVDDGYPRDLANSIAARFTELGLIDDTRFAALWARGRASAGYGHRRIVRELQDRGIDPELAEATCADACGEPVAAARAVLRGRTASTRHDRDKLVRRLVRRGFDLRTALEATSDSVDSGADDQPFISE